MVGESLGRIHMDVLVDLHLGVFARGARVPYHVGPLVLAVEAGRRAVAWRQAAFPWHRSRLDEAERRAPVVRFAMRDARPGAHELDRAAAELLGVALAVLVPQASRRRHRSRSPCPGAGACRNRVGCTPCRSFTSRNAPQCRLTTRNTGPPAYSANEKWNRDVSQCLHDHAPSGLSGGLPNQLGFGCET